MDNQTRIGTGAAALIAILSILEPHFMESHPIIGVLIYGVLALIVIWGFAPVFTAILARLRKNSPMFGADALIVLSIVGLIAGCVWRFSAPPFPGYGESPAPKSEAPFRLEETARFNIEPGLTGKAFDVDNTNPNALTFKERQDAPAPIAKSNDKEPPNVLSVFVHDVSTLTMNGAVVSASVDLDAGPKQFRVFYYAIYNFQADTKYLSVFIPHSPLTHAILQGMPRGYKRLFENIENRFGADYKMQGQANTSRTWDLRFSGRINIYTDDQLDTEQLGRLTTEFRDNGATAYFYSTDYVHGAWQNIRLGIAKPIDLYQLSGDPPEIKPVPPRS